MFKKISVVMALSMTILFGGTFTNSANAAANIEQPQNQINYNIYYSINDGWDASNWNQLESYLSKYFQKWNKDYWHSPSQKVDKPKREAPKEEQLEKEHPKSEQPKEEQPEKEQPKEEKPEKEQPKEEKPEKEQPKQEVPEIDQPSQEQAQQKEDQQPTSQVYQLNQFEQQVVELTNNEREKNGLSPLKVDWELSRVSHEKSRDLAANNYFAHNSPTYGSPFDMMKAYGISYRTAGENIAKGQNTPQEVVNAWMNSPGHRANILNDNFTHIGVGYVEQGNHWTQMFIGK